MKILKLKKLSNCSINNYIFLNFKILLLIVFLLPNNFLIAQINYNNYDYIFDNKITLDQNRTINTNNETVLINYSINRIKIEEKTLNNQKYFNFYINGFSNLKEDGLPTLPFKIDLIGFIDDDSKVIIEDTSYIEFNNINILPFISQYNIENKKIQFIDTNIYKENRFYPKELVKIENIQYYKNIPLGFISTNPIQINPITKKIRIYSKIKYSIKTKSSEISKKVFNISKNDYTFFQSIIDNQIDFKIDTNYIPKMLILTHPELKDAVEKFAEWKSQLGIKVIIRYNTKWNPIIIKNTINTEQIVESNIDFIILFGDHDGTYAVPSDTSSVFIKYPFNTDQIYSCKNNNDFIPDINLGRISVRTKEEALNVINKIIEYEKEPINDSNFYKTITHSSYFQDNDNKPTYEDIAFVLTSEDIIDYLNTKNLYKINRVYFTYPSINPLFFNNDYFCNGKPLPNYLHKPNFPWNGSKSQIIKDINDGSLIVLHRGHGLWDGKGWEHPKFLVEDLDSLSNENKYPLIININCSSGQFTAPYSISEKMLNKEKSGAIAVIGASNTSFSGSNDILTKGIYKALFPDLPITNQGFLGVHPTPAMPYHSPIYNISKSLNYGLITMSKIWGGDIKLQEYQYRIFHYFGDPSLNLCTKNPNNHLINATHQNTLNCYDTILNIQSNTDSALVVLSYKNYIFSSTIISGKKAVLKFKFPFYADSVNITISKYNHKPYISNISIVNNTCIYPPRIDTAFVNEISYNNTKFITKLISDGGSPIESNGIIIGYNPAINLQNNENIYYANSPNNNQFNTTTNNLLPNTKYYAKAFVKNKIGIVYSDIMEFKTICYAYDTFPKVISFVTLNTPECWHIYDHQGNDQIWQIGRINNLNIPFEGNYIYINSEAYGHNNYQNTDFETPTLDFTNYISPKISFKHYLRHYSYSEEKFFVSTDDGLSWSLVKSWNANVLTPEICSFTFDSLSNKKNIKFKWNYSAKWSYYWCIDDIKIEGAVIGVEEINNNNKKLLIYPNPNNGIVNLIFTSYDKNLNIEILDLNSKNVFNKYIDYQNSNLYNIQLNLKSLHKGVYLIKINGIKTNLYNKLIINE